MFEDIKGIIRTHTKKKETKGGIKINNTIDRKQKIEHTDHTKTRECN